MQRSLLKLVHFRNRRSLVISWRFFNDEIYQHQGKPASFQNTLTYWIISQFRNDKKYVSLSREDIFNCSNKSWNSLNTDSLLNIWLESKEGKCKIPPSKFESEVLSRVKAGKFDEVVTILDAGFTFYDHKFINSAVYELSLSRLEFLMRNNQKGSVYHSIQCLYFCSLLKKSKSTEKLMSILADHVCQSLDKLTNVELSIVCLSLFKCSMKPPELLSKSLIERLKQNIIWFLENSSIMTSFIKSLRHGLVYDDALFQLLIDNYDRIKQLDTVSKIHLLVYLADSLFSNTDFMVVFIKDVCQDIQEGNNQDLRFKDIDNLLWSASNYWQYNLSEIFGNVDLLRKIHQLIKTENISLSDRFNALYYLWILKVKDKYLLRFLNKNNILEVKRQNNFKDLSRLSLLLTCISIEDSKLITKDILELRETRLQPKLKKYFILRPKIQMLLKELLKNKNSLILSNVEFNFPITCLNIASVACLHTSGRIVVEICDETATYRGSNQPHGIMTLKLRLLDRLGVKYYLIQDELNDKSSKTIMENMKKWLKTL